MVCVADGTELAAEKLDRVLTADPGMGVIRHADAGYDRARRGRRASAACGSRWPSEPSDVSSPIRRDRAHPVLRERAREVTAEELATPEVQRLIDDMIETKRAANGAGLAATQVGEPLRIAIAEVEPDNPRYPYKPPIPLTVFVNPVIEPLDDELVVINEGCLSVPDLRGEVQRHVNVRVTLPRPRRRRAHDEVRRGLTAGTFQHEVDHLDGILFVDRARPAHADHLGAVRALPPRGVRASRPADAASSGWAREAPSLLV